MVQLQAGEIVSVRSGETVITPGAKNMATIVVQVKEGYHIQANKVSNESLVPATLTIVGAGPFHIGQAIFPPYKLFRLEGTTNDLNIFDSVFSIQLPISAPGAIKPGRYVIKARFRYQACDART